MLAFTFHHLMEVSRIAPASVSSCSSLFLPTIQISTLFQAAQMWIDLNERGVDAPERSGSDCGVPETGQAAGGALGWLLLGVAADFALRQCLLQFGHTRLGYFGVIQVKGPELLELDHFLETRIRYLG